MLELVAAFICLTTLLTYVNFRFIGLPPTIGVMVTALVFSLILQGLSVLGYPGLEERIQQLIGQIDFGDLLMNWMLSFLLFAGALHVNLNDLRSYRWPIGLLATFGVLIATVVIGSLAYYIFALFGWHVSFLYCLLFGALISPTDPIAVLGVLRTANASKPLKRPCDKASLRPAAISNSDGARSAPNFFKLSQDESSMVELRQRPRMIRFIVNQDYLLTKICGMRQSRLPSPFSRFTS